MIINTVEQRTAEWRRLRWGNVSGSMVSCLIGRGRKQDFTQTGMAYIYQLAAERGFNRQFLEDDDVFADYIEQSEHPTRAMQWGTEQEEPARELYTRLTGLGVRQVAICTHDGIEGFCASPDGLVEDGENGLGILEIKCPSMATFAQYRAEVHDGATLKAVKPEYYWQMQAEMDCAGAKWGDFTAYCPWLSNPVHIVRIKRDEEDTALMEERVKEALAKIKELTESDKQ